MKPGATVDVNGNVLSVRGAIDLNSDGTMTLNLPGAAQWCQFHDKGLRIVLANPSTPEPDLVFQEGEVPEIPVPGPIEYGSYQ